jgi:hypothetical protein
MSTMIRTRASRVTSRARITRCIAMTSRYILEAEFDIGGTAYGPGTLLFHPDPHFESDLRTETGGLMLLVQYQGPTTGGRPIYDGRFNVSERKPLEQEQFNV